MRQRRKVVSENPETLIAEVEDEPQQGRFFACYLLTSRSPRHKGHTYIGFTVNPRRRIRQHNGEIAQGAWRTKRKRPWEMVLCIYGFPTNVSALQFEWAWQNPTVSKAVRQAAASFKTLGGLANKIKLAYTMLTLPPWQSLNITVNFFSTQYMKHSAGCPRLPEQMRVKICPMDELPSCTIRSEDRCEDEDEWCNERECDEDMNSSQEEMLSGFAFRSSQDDKQTDIGNGSSEGYRPNREVGGNEWWNDKGCDEAMNNITLQEDTLSCFAVHNSAEDKQGNVSKTIIKVHALNEEEEDKECDQPMDDITLQEDMLSYFAVVKSTEDQQVGARKTIAKVHGSNEEEEDFTEKFGFITSPVRMPSSNVTTSSNIEVPKDMLSSFGPSDDRSNYAQFTTIVADDDQSPSRSYLRPCVAGVIDLTTPSPLCRNGLCGKKSRTTTAYPQIIDLTKSPNFIQL